MNEPAASVQNSQLTEFLSALFAACPNDPITLVAGDQEEQVNSAAEIDAFVGSADAEPVYVRPVADGKVAFLHLVIEGAHDPQGWQDYTLKPTAVLHRGEDKMMLSLYALDAPAEPSEDTERLLSKMGGDAEDLIPTPDSNGWTLIHLDPETFTTVAAMAAAYDDAPAGALPSSDRLHDAIFATPYDPADPTYAQEMVISIGAGRESVKWAPKTMSIATFVDQLSVHREDAKKDGLAFVLAEIVGPNRRKVAVKACYGVGLDIDVGVPGSVIDAELAKLGCLAIRYSTHSHWKTKTNFKKDRLTRFASKLGTELDEATITRFLREEEHWDESIVSTAEYVGDEHQPEGLMAQISHAPMPKHRVIVPLAEPFAVTEVAKTQDEGMKLWNLLPKALARVLGDLPLDKAALDPSRLFYFPRHAKGRPHETAIFGGPLLDWKTLDLDDAPKDAFEAALEQETGGSKGSRKSGTSEGQALGRWSRKAAHGFQIVDVIRDHDPDRIRTNGATKIDIECPFDEEHSNPGDPEDRGCFCVNAGDGPSEIFTIKCQHDSCQERTNLDMLGKMIKDGWFAAEVLDDSAYNPDAPDPVASVAAEDDAREQREIARQTYEAAIGGLTSESSEEAAEAVARLIVDADLKPLAHDRAIESMQRALKRKTKGPITALIAAAQAARSQREPAAEEVSPGFSREVLTRLTTEFPFPEEAFGEFTYRPFAGRPWCYELDRDADQPRWVRLFTPWSIVGGVEYADRDQTSGLRLRVLNASGATAVVDLPAGNTVLGQGAELKVALRERGVGMTDQGERRIVQLAKQIQPARPVTIFDRAGFRDGRFLTPWGRVIGPDSQVAELASGVRPKGLETSGTLDGWRTATKAAFDSGVLHWQVGVLAGFVAPLIDLTGMPSRLLAFTGHSGRGKSTAHVLQNSAWGDVRPKLGLIGSFDMTTSAPEALLSRASGSGCSFDEAHLIGGKDLQHLVFKVAGDAGRDRMTASAELRQSRSWRLFVTFSSEQPVAPKIAADGGVAANGLGARLLELNVDDTAMMTAEEMAEIEAVKAHVGHAGPRFVEELFRLGYVANPHALEAEIAARAEVLIKAAPTDQRRAALIAALIWRAGEIAQQAGLIPTKFPIVEADQHDDGGEPPKDDLERLARALWKQSLKSDASAEAPAAKAIEALRLSLIRRRGVDVAEGFFNDGRPTVAWRVPSFIKLPEKPTQEQADSHHGGHVYIIPTETIAPLAGGRLTAKAVAKALDEAGMLLPFEHSGRRERVWPRIAGLGEVRAVVVKATAVEGLPEAESR